VQDWLGLPRNQGSPGRNAKRRYLEQQRMLEAQRELGIEPEPETPLLLSPQERATRRKRRVSVSVELADLPPSPVGEVSRAIYDASARGAANL
jgi:hypothetical protein